MTLDVKWLRCLGIAACLASAFPSSLAGQGWNKSPILSSRNFTLTAWYCEGGGCSSYPRRLISSVRFDQTKWQEQTIELDHLTTSWNVVLICAVVRQRLTRCIVQDDTVSSKRGIAIATMLAKKLRIRRYVLDPPVGKRALVAIEYLTGQCPMCPNTPPPQMYKSKL